MCKMQVFFGVAAFIFRNKTTIKICKYNKTAPPAAFLCRASEAVDCVNYYFLPAALIMICSISTAAAI